MSIHPCEWASQKGCELKLSCPERVTLWQLARRAATKGFCWPSLTQLAFDTGLHRETLVKVVQTLASHGLIRIEREGQRLIYHLLQPVGNPTDRSENRPVKLSTTGRKSDRSNGKSDQPTGRKSDRNRSEKPQEPVGNPTQTYKENIKTNHARAREAAASDREPESKILNSEKQEEATAPPPAPPPTAPVSGATDGSAGQPPDHFNDWLDSGAPADGSMHCATDAEVVTEDDTPRTEPDREHMAAQIAALVHELSQSKRRFAIPPGPQFTRWEQLDVMASKRQWKQPTPEQLQAMYRAQGLHRGASP